ncbi:protein RKD5-like [Pyrus ussuriensis x Pyrus communis]|uniref:Protein RKD5-like n=1 Tax=Pyrus ussuriensis x Pyrus communis TaxID=2448454 RepID=A0A5N5FY44_9ROSA|nr:protein RKD5-like [Pyrus ussuriensis x Pyrus communis]
MMACSSKVWVAARLTMVGVLRGKLWKILRLHKLIKSLYVYGLDEGKRNKVEREFEIRENEVYVELPAASLMRLMKFAAS